MQVNQMPSEPHPKNVPGDFYVEHGCCLCCDVPFIEAPGLFEYDETHHCFVKQQPRTDAEVTQIMSAAACSETGCIRYRGHDPAIFERFGALGETGLCDHPPEGGIPIAIRNIATFKTKSNPPTAISSAELIELFKRHLQDPHRSNAWQDYRFTETKKSARSASFSYAWYENNFHEVNCIQIDRPDAEFLITNQDAAYVGISDTIHEWLASETYISDIRWYVGPKWREESKWYAMPW